VADRCTHDRTHRAPRCPARHRPVDDDRPGRSPGSAHPGTGGPVDHPHPGGHEHAPLLQPHQPAPAGRQAGPVHCPARRLSGQLGPAGGRRLRGRGRRQRHGGGASGRPQRWGDGRLLGLLRPGPEPQQQAAWRGTSSPGWVWWPARRWGPRLPRSPG